MPLELADKAVFSAVAAGEAAWTRLIAPERFVAHLALHAPTHAPFDGWLSAVELPDLYLAAACSEGEPRALAAFEAAYFGDVAGILERTGQRSVLDEDFLQALRERIFVPREELRPRIASYTGRGRLAGWFKMVLLRMASHHRTRGQPQPAVDLEWVERVLVQRTTPELQVIKEHSRLQVKPLFAEALGSLGAEQRLLLRQVFLDDLTGEQLSALYHVHRTTVARRVGAACDALRKRIHSALALKVDDEDVTSSILRMVESQLSMSLERLLPSA